MNKKYVFATPERIERYKEFKTTLYVPQLNDRIRRNLSFLQRAHNQLMNSYKNMFRILKLNAEYELVSQNKAMYKKYGKGIELY